MTPFSTNITHRPRSAGHFFKSLLLLCSALACLGMASSCAVHTCSQEYAAIIAGNRQYQSMTSLHRSAATPRQLRRIHEYCGILQAYQRCIDALSKSCRGNLEYHTVVTLIRSWIKGPECANRFVPSSNFQSRSYPDGPPSMQVNTRRGPPPPLLEADDGQGASSLGPGRRRDRLERRRDERRKERRRLAAQVSRKELRSQELPSPNITSASHASSYSIVVVTICTFTLLIKSLSV